jgi:hypothetical protein
MTVTDGQEKTDATDPNDNCSLRPPETVIVTELVTETNNQRN